MIRKKLLARIMSVVLTSAVVCSSLAGVPATIHLYSATISAVTT